MAARSTSELRAQALATLQAGRKEISAEAQWLRRELNPRHAAQRITREHTGGVLLAAFAVGLAVPWLLGGRSKKHRDDDSGEPARRDFTAKKSAAAKVGVGAYLTGLVFKAATPFLVKEGLKIAEQFMAAAVPQAPSRGPAMQRSVK